MSKEIKYYEVNKLKYFIQCAIVWAIVGLLIFSPIYLILI